MKYLNALLVFAVVAIIGEYFHWSPVIIFFAAALGVIPLAGFMGRATEEIAIYTGPRIGGLLNATLGNPQGPIDPGFGLYHRLNLRQFTAYSRFEFVIGRDQKWCTKV
jgi:hypothetical protein